MTSERIKEIQETTAYPESLSVMLALKQVWNECAQEQNKNSYSEEEVEKLLLSCKDAFGGSGLENYTTDDEVIEWFEKFKKKA
jgi:hypothetical protein